jgi:hypothetical protein
VPRPEGIGAIGGTRASHWMGLPPAAKKLRCSMPWRFISEEVNLLIIGTRAGRSRCIGRLPFGIVVFGNSLLPLTII